MRAKAVVLAGAARSRIVRLEDETGRPLDRGPWERLLDLALRGVGDRYTGAADLVRVTRQGHFLDSRLRCELIGFDPGSAWNPLESTGHRTDQRDLVGESRPGLVHRDSQAVAAWLHATPADSREDP